MKFNGKSKQGLYRPSMTDGSIWIGRDKRNELNGFMGAILLLVRSVCRNERRMNMKVKELKEKLDNIDENAEIVITVCDSSRTKYMSALLEQVRYNKIYGYVTLSCIKEDK